jgi:hypothetical protein
MYDGCSDSCNLVKNKPCKKVAKNLKTLFEMLVLSLTWLFFAFAVTFGSVLLIDNGFCAFYA